MPKKRTSKVVKNDFEYDEGEVCGFTSEVPTDGNCISSFSFDDDSDVKILKLTPNLILILILEQIISPILKLILFHLVTPIISIA